MQLIITHGKEQLLCEKRFRAAFYCKLKCGIAPVIRSADFDSFEAFAGKVQQEWDALWAKVYDTPLQGLPEMHIGVGGVRGVVLPLYKLIGQALISMTAVLLFVGVLLCVLRLALFSRASMAVAGVVGALTALSLHRACSHESASIEDQHPKSKTG